MRKLYIRQRFGRRRFFRRQSRLSAPWREMGMVVHAPGVYDVPEQFTLNELRRKR